jgi:hypothetical protein
LANITNLKTHRANKEDVREFIALTALQDYMGLRSVGRSHVIAWRKDMDPSVPRCLSASTRAIPPFSPINLRAAVHLRIGWAHYSVHRGQLELGRRIGNSSFDALAGSLLKMFDFDHESQEKRLFLDPNTGEPCRF